MALSNCYNENNLYEIGVDEAGRGPLFGRLYVAGAILPKGGSFHHEWMKDSKRFHSKKKIHDMVWARLNKMIDQYAEENHIHLLFGANGTGTILYGKASKDDTKPLVIYCNKQYKDEK